MKPCKACLRSKEAAYKGIHCLDSGYLPFLFESSAVILQKTKLICIHSGGIEAERTLTLKPAGWLLAPVLGPVALLCFFNVPLDHLPWALWQIRRALGRRSFRTNAGLGRLMCVSSGTEYIHYVSRHIIDQLKCILYLHGFPPYTEVVKTNEWRPLTLAQFGPSRVNGAGFYIKMIAIVSPSTSDNINVSTLPRTLSWLCALTKRGDERILLSLGRKRRIVPKYE
jgi:hypothetical protein